MVWLLAAVVMALGLWCLAVRPRRGQAGWEKLEGFRYAHRGLHDLANGRPENSLSAFQAAARAGFGAELDVHLMADGNLAVVHDSELTRVCGRAGRIEDLRREDLAGYPLLGSGENIPLLEDVLAVFEGKAPLIVELKTARHNAAALTDAVMERLLGWRGTYCVESFRPAALWRLQRKWPGVFRGQLSCAFRGQGKGLHEKAAYWAVRHLLVCAVSRPDFVAYRWQDRDEPSLALARKLWGVHEVYWTVRDPAVMERLEAEGGAVIFEGFVPSSKRF